MLKAQIRRFNALLLSCLSAAPSSGRKTRTKEALILLLYREERCEFLPYMSPLQVTLRPSDGRITHLVLARTEQRDDDSGSWFVDEEQTMKKKCDFVISAFGSALYSKDVLDALQPLKLTKWGAPEVDNLKNDHQVSNYCYYKITILSLTTIIRND
jgi:NADPH-dependent glutamate synthase beta subunit-like oxidoreductase